MEDSEHKNPSHKSQTLHRIKIIQGHLKAIEKMIEGDVYCVDIIHQSIAVQKALKKLDLAIMEGHIRHCVVDQAKNGDEKKIVDDLLSLYSFK